MSAELDVILLDEILDGEGQLEQVITSNKSIAKSPV